MTTRFYDSPPGVTLVIATVRLDAPRGNSTLPPAPFIPSHCGLTTKEAAHNIAVNLARAQGQVFTSFGWVDKAEFDAYQTALAQSRERRRRTGCHFMEPRQPKPQRARPEPKPLPGFVEPAPLIDIGGSLANIPDANPVEMGLERRVETGGLVVWRRPAKSGQWLQDYYARQSSLRALRWALYAPAVAQWWPRVAWAGAVAIGLAWVVFG